MALKQGRLCSQSLRYPDPHNSNGGSSRADRTLLYFTDCAMLVVITHTLFTASHSNHRVDIDYWNKYFIAVQYFFKTQKLSSLPPSPSLNCSNDSGPVLVV